MRETKLYSKLRPKLMQWGTCDRVENTLGSGMSDVFYNIGGKVGWLETKVAKGGDVYFEKFQPNWMRKHVRQGFDRMFVVILDKSESILLYRAEDVLSVPMYAKNDWLIVQMDDLPHPVVDMTAPYREWDEFRLALIS